MRLFPPEAQLRLWTYWGIWSCSSPGLWVSTPDVATGPSKKRGECYSNWCCTATFSHVPPRLASILVGIFFVATAPAVWVVGSFRIAEPNSNLWLSQLNMETMFGLFGTAWGITYFWWHKRVRLGENGIVLRHEFLPWSQLQRCYWDACYPNVVVMRFLGQLGGVAARVPPVILDAVDALLKKNLSYSNRPDGAVAKNKAPCSN